MLPLSQHEQECLLQRDMHPALAELLHRLVILCVLTRRTRRQLRGQERGLRDEWFGHGRRKQCILIIGLENMKNQGGEDMIGVVIDFGACSNLKYVRKINKLLNVTERETY